MTWGKGSNCKPAVYTLKRPEIGARLGAGTTWARSSRLWVIIKSSRRSDVVLTTPFLSYELTRLECEDSWCMGKFGVEGLGLWDVLLWVSVLSDCFEGAGDMHTGSTGCCVSGVLSLHGSGVRLQSSVSAYRFSDHACLGFTFPGLVLKMWEWVQRDKLTPHLLDPEP